MFLPPPEALASFPRNTPGMKLFEGGNPLHAGCRQNLAAMHDDETKQNLTRGPAVSFRHLQRWICARQKLMIKLLYQVPSG